MRPTLIAVVLLLAFSVATDAEAQLPETPKLPTLGRGLFARKPSEKAVENMAPNPGAPTVFSPSPSTQAGREATLQALQDCYAREAVKVRASGAPESRVRRLRQLCENEEMADTRAFLKWSKIGAGRSTQRILNAVQEDAAEKALNGGEPLALEKP